MAADLPIPGVTTDDLLAFHAKHFGRFFQGALLTGEADGQYAEEYYEDEDDGLGYYPDGIKRTLTDDQIAIFRHSEIQRLLLKQRREAEAAADTEAEVDQAVEADTESGLKPGSHASNASRAQSTDDGEVEEENEDEEYAKFLKKERQHFEIDAEKKRSQARKAQHQKESQDRSVSTRRRVRELDDIVKQEDVVLEY